MRADGQRVQAAFVVGDKKRKAQLQVKQLQVGKLLLVDCAISIPCQPQWQDPELKLIGAQCISLVDIGYGFINLLYS